MKVSFAPRPSAEVCHLPLEEGDPHPPGEGVDRYGGQGTAVPRQCGDFARTLPAGLLFPNTPWVARKSI